MNITIATYATQRYRYALPNFGRRIAGTLTYAKVRRATFLFVGDETPELEEDARKYIEEQLPAGIEFVYLPLKLSDENLGNYDESTQLLIAQLQSHAFAYARRIDTDIYWSLESDVLVPYNAYSVSMDILGFDNGYYDVAMCSYPSQGGGPFLGGRGNYNAQIADDFLDEERVIPKELLKRKKELFAEKERNEEWGKKAEAIRKEIKECPPKGNVYELNGKKWRQRGWMEYAYPAIGKGAIVPTDWVGLGCTMLSKKALALAHFDGYEGHGTQDLYLGWHRWKPEGLNMAVTTHAICDHIVRIRDKDTQDYQKFQIVNAYHEPEGELIGHLRQRYTEHYKFIAGEKPKKSSTIVEEKKK